MHTQRGKYWLLHHQNEEQKRKKKTPKKMEIQEYGNSKIPKWITTKWNKFT